MYKAILFDLGKVLVPFDFSIAYGRMKQLSGLSANEIRSRLAATPLFREFETGLIEADTFAALVMELIGFKCGIREFSDIWSSIFLPETLIPESLIAILKRHYRLVLVSNTNALHFEMLRRNYQVLELFDRFVLSFEVRAMKPSARFYEAALAAAGCAPGECVFIDDLAENVRGAQEAGFDAIQFESLARLEAELTARRIHWQV